MDELERIMLNELIQSQINVSHIWFLDYVDS